MDNQTYGPSTSRQPSYLLLLLFCLALLTLGGGIQAAPSGLPFAEDFASQALQDPALTNAHWSTEEQALMLAWRSSHFGAFGPEAEGSDVSGDAHSTYALALGDVDGDGDLDIIAGNNGQSNRLYLNNGSATPFAGVEGSDVGNFTETHDTEALVLGDVDGDGDLDLIAGNRNQTNRLYLNDGSGNFGTGSFGSGSDISSDAHNTTTLVLGDVDGDGDLDLIAGNNSIIQPNRLYLNNGTADPFAGVTGVDVSSDAHQTNALALGDVDGDGDLDLVAGNMGGSGLNRNRLYLNNGTDDPFAGVTTGIDVSIDGHATYSLALGDVDGDGDLDLIAGNSSQRNRLYLNNGTADPWNGVNGVDVSSDLRITYALALGDVDGDGDLDLIAGDYSVNGSVNTLYLNNGTADPFAGVVGSDVSGDKHKTYALALGDVDGDGDLDLIAGNSAQPNRIYLNERTPDPFIGVAGGDVGSDTNDTLALALGDVDRDGDLDLIAGNSAQPNRLYLNNGTADPWNGVTGVDVTSDTHDTYALALGDVDGDGDLDLLAGNNGSANRLYLNDGTSAPWNTVAEGIAVSSDADATRALALRDVDGDGDLDLIAGNSGVPNRLYLNNGSADPWNGVTGIAVSGDTHDTYSLALGDVDGDGDLDLFAGNSSAQTNRLYLNNGTADPWNGVNGINVSDDGHDTLALALGDVDKDGDLDLIAGNSSAQTGGQTNRLYLNNGTADPFAGVTATDVTTDTHKTQALALRDVDKDGDLDLIAGNSGSTNRLYLNNGSADPWNGVTASDMSSDTNDTLALALGDVDGDGDLDLIAGNFNTQTNRFYLSNSASTLFAGVEGSDLGSDLHDTRALALGDVDGDGDVDLIAGNTSQTSRLYLNSGTAYPFTGVTGTDVSSDAQNTRSLALGDVDRDGDLDLIVGNNGSTNRLYLNNGTADPWSGVSGSDVSSDGDNTEALALGDVDGDGDLDLIVGNNGSANRLYLNNGTADPWSGVAGVDVTGDTNATRALALGDVDGDGDLDLIVGNNSSTNRLYLNNGTADPWNGVTGSDVTSDSHSTFALALGDVDGDGDLDLIAGNSGSANRLYVNNGTADPWNGVAASDVSNDAHDTLALALSDVDGDGDLDLIAGNNGTANRLYLNNGTADPWNGVTGRDVTSDTHRTYALALGDVTGDGHLDLIAGNSEQANRLYQRRLYDTSRGWAGSVRVDGEVSNIDNATLTPTASQPRHTRVVYWLSNNGGAKWYLVQPGVNFSFPTSGIDLRWRADLRSLSPVHTPRIDGIVLTTERPELSVAIAPASLAEDDIGTLIYTFTRTGAVTDTLSINFSVGGTALFESDYTQSGAASFTVTGGTVTIAAGSTSATVAIDPMADTTSESDETVILTVTVGTGYIVGSPGAATGTITNDDAAPTATPTVTPTPTPTSTPDDSLWLPLVEG